MADIQIKKKWDLVRGNNLPTALRHTLLVLMHVQGDNASAWCKRECLADEIGISVGTLSNHTAKLESLGILKKIWTNRFDRPCREYQIQFDELRICQRPTSRESEGVPSRENEGGRNNEPSTLTKSWASPSRHDELHPHEIVRHEESVNNHKKNQSSRQHRFTDADMQTADFIWTLIQKMQPDRKRPNLDKWANTVRLMRERDNRTDDKIRELFEWCNRDSFWSTNILCPDKLREKWDDLQLRRNKDLGNSDANDDWPDVMEIVCSIYQPDIRNTADVEAKLTPAQFAAAKSVGLKRIATAGKFDKATPAAYRTARKAVA